MPALVRPGDRQHDHAHHEGVVVRTADEVDDQERVDRGEPRRLMRIDADLAGDPGQTVHDQRDADQGRNTLGDRRVVRVEAGELVQPVRQRQGERAVGGRGVAPQPRHLVGERAGQDAGRDLVRVQPVLDQPALSGVRVGVVAEDRGRRDERYRPPAQDRPRLHVVVDRGTQPVPGDDQQADGTDDEHGGHDARPGGVQAERPHHRPVGAGLGQVGRRQ